jgi:glycosyltransferase involved in cell wall biosynthesis
LFVLKIFMVERSTNNNMKISVITATFNRAATIERALQSVKSQTYKNIQITVVDGASTDETISKAKDVIGKTDIIISEPDEGIYDALNKGLEISNGEIIGFLHSDDLFYDDDVISKVVDVFADHTIDVVYGDACFFSGQNSMEVRRRYRSSKLTLKNLAWGKMPAHPSIFIRRRIYDEIGYFETNFKIAADYEFLCRLAKLPNLRSVYLPFPFVRMQLGGASTGGFSSTILLNKEVLRAIKKNGIYTNLLMVLSKYPSKIMEYFSK